MHLARLSAAAVLVAAGTLVTLGLPAPASAAPSVPCGPSPAPSFFVDPVAQPPVAAPDRPGHYTLTATLSTHRFASGWPAVPSLGYQTANAPVGYLGPTIVTKQGEPIDVTLVNGLPPAGTRIFPFDQPNDDNAVVMHRHGGIQPVDSDGVPGQEVKPGQSRTNHYPNTQAAAPLWYHDHADHTTSYTVYEGLAGFMPNTDATASRFPLPSGDFAKAFVLQDKSFNADHTLCYSHADPEFFGDLPVVNGTVAPYQPVQPRRYTFTFINGSDSRFFHLTLAPVSGAATTAAPKMTVVGGDSGYLFRPAPVGDLLIAPGERYIVVVDFTGFGGQGWVLRNDAAAPYPDGAPGVPAVPRLMLFSVGATADPVDDSSIPPTLPESNNTGATTSALAQARVRTVQAGENADGDAMLGDATQLRFFTDPATETPQLGSTEAWAMRNRSPDSHPIHLHMVELRLLGRWPVGKWDAAGQPVPSTIGAFQPAPAYESGPKDTFVAPRNFITVWVGTFTVAGTSVWHCHILSHEDGAVEMMRPLVVGDTPQTQLPVVHNLTQLDRLIRAG